MGMAQNQLFADAAAHVVDVKGALALGHVGVKDDLQQHIPQLLAKQRIVLVVDSLASLIHLFDKVAADALVRLLAIPGAAVLAAQDFHDLQQIVKAIAFFFFKIYHKCSPFSSKAL